jgi:hypothetical protein
MKVIKTTVTTRPSTDIKFEQNLPIEIRQSQEEMLVDGRIISIIETTSEDQLTSNTVKIFASIDDYIYNRSLFNEFIKTELEYMANNGITETVSLAFEE